MLTPDEVKPLGTNIIASGVSAKKDTHSFRGPSFFSRNVNPGEVKPLVDFDWGVSPFSGDSDHFWREHPANSGTGLFILGQHYLFQVSMRWVCFPDYMGNRSKMLPANTRSASCVPTRRGNYPRGHPRRDLGLSSLWT